MKIGEKVRMQGALDIKSALTVTAFVVFMAAVLQLGGCGSAPSVVAHAETVKTTRVITPLEANFGIHVETLHLSAAGNMLDFRYRVVDKDKAAALLDSKLRPYLLDEQRGAKFAVPDTPILGQLRQTSRNHAIKTDHSYFILFANPGKFLRAGDKVTLVMGEAKLPDLTIE